MSATAPGASIGDTVARPGIARLNKALVVVLVAGTVVRLAHYLLGRSLWVDEARIALNIASRSWTELVQPLTYDQSAPLLFLTAAKGLTVVFGVHEWALRALPVAAGIGVVWLTYPVVRRFVCAPAAVTAAAVAAFSPSMIFFSNEAKPYSSDALATLVVLALAIAWHERPADTGRWVRLTTAGTILVWLSAPVFLVLVGIGAALLLDDRIRSGSAGRLLLTGALWLISFGVAYLLVYQPASRSPYLRDYWAPAMLVPGTPDLPGRTWLAIRSVVWGILFGHSGPIAASPGERVLMTPMTVLLLGLLLLGASHLWRQSRPRAALVLAPMAVVLGAAVVGMYPLALRLSLFTAGLLLILLAAGVERVAGSIAPGRRSLAHATIATVLLVFPATHSVPDLMRWSAPEHTRPLIQRYEAEGGNEPIYVHAGALPAWAFYTTDWTSPDTARLAFLSRVGTSGGAAFENAPSRGHAVVGEGSELVRTYRGRKEIFGVPVGLQWHAFIGTTKPQPDPGWAEHEVARIRAEAHDAIWVLLAHLSVLGPEKQFYSEMTARAKSEVKWYERGAMLARYRLR